MGDSDPLRGESEREKSDDPPGTIDVLRRPRRAGRASGDDGIDPP